MRKIIVVARFVSMLFRPAYYPLAGGILLLTLTYLSMLPWQFKTWMIAIIWLFTIMLPRLLVRTFPSFSSFSSFIRLLCSIICFIFMKHYHLPAILCGVIFVYMLIQTVCMLIKTRADISTHSAGSGGLIGGLLVYSFLFGFNPLWWLCGCILLSGVVMTSRMLLRRNTLWQVLGGTLVGVVCGYVGIMYA